MSSSSQGFIWLRTSRVKAPAAAVNVLYFQALESRSVFVITGSLPQPANVTKVKISSGSLNLFIFLRFSLITESACFRHDQTLLHASYINPSAVARSICMGIKSDSGSIDFHHPTQSF
jgi:hypothetical protein